jgi:hypothetical protein
MNQPGNGYSEGAILQKALDDIEKFEQETLPAYNAFLKLLLKYANDTSSVDLSELKRLTKEQNRVGNEYLQRVKKLKALFRSHGI